MSHPPPPKLTEARAKSKFQSLNINNIYQGAANKNSSKGPPPKHGLQSLGKVPTARRAPANLPSVKAEKGNDPRVLLVPTGGSGWTKDGEKQGSTPKGTNSVSKPEPKEPAAPATSVNKPSGVKSWSSVTGASKQGRSQTFGHQKSPLFGQEFPSLRTGEGGVPLPEGTEQKPLSQGANRLQLESQPGKEDLLERNTYGPGPNLRPQTFGNWTQGGIKVPGGPQPESQLETGPIIPPQPHKPVPPGASAQFNSKSPSNQSSSANQYKSIMPPFMDVMELPTGPPEGMGGGRRISRSGQQQRERREPPPRSRPTNTEFAPPSIIDTEKLRLMDTISGGDDWTYDDDNFDYNKRLQSDDEDAAVETESTRTDPNWADHVEKPSPPYNFYEEMKKPAGFGLDEEEKKRTKKSEEVMKNIERARQRREEEENRYRRPGSEEFYKEERGGGRRFDEGAKENTTPSVERKDWGYEDKRQKQPRSFEDRRDERGDRFDQQQRREGGGYYPQRFDRADEKPRKEEYPRNEAQFEDEYSKGYGVRKEQRSFDDRNRSAEEAQPFTDFTNTEDSRSDGRWSGKSPVYNRQHSQLSTSESPEVELENGTNEWGRPAKGMTDWVEEVDNMVLNDRYEAEVDQHSRPNSRDSRISRDSRGSKDGKGSRNSVEKTKKMPEFEEEKPGRLDNPIPEQYDVERKQQIQQAKKPAPAAQDLRGYFRDTPVEQKKVIRAAPGPITREKLDASDKREMTNMTQLKKLDSKPDSKPIETVEKLNPLIDSDMLENISDDEDCLLDTLEREDKASGHGVRGRGRGRGQAVEPRKPGPRGGRGGERGVGGRGARGGRGEFRGRGNHGRYMEQEGMEETDEMRNNRKNYDKFPDKQGPPPPIGFMPRGQPSRRGRGEGKINRGNFGRGGMSRHMNEGDEYNEDMGDWNENEYGQGRGGKIPPRMQKKRDERRKMEGEEVEEWETASEHSNEEREKRKREMERGRGRGGGRGWEMRGARRGVGHPNDMREQTPEHDGMKKRSGIENIDLHDFASVVVVDQDSGHHDQELEQGDGGEFMQVVNKKTRPIVGRDDRKSFERPGQKMNERGGYDQRYRDPRDNFNKPNKTYERRQNKLPPRLAKVREVSRAQARSGGISPSGMEQNGWPEGDKMGVFQVEDLGTTAWEKPPPRREMEGSDGTDMRASPKTGKENGGIQQTMVFENTALKGGKGEKMDKSGIQLPVCLGKPEDNLDVKLDFSFGGDDLSGQVKPPLRSMPHLSSSQGLPASPSTDDLSAKLANTKKLWDSPGMAAVPENSATTASSWNDGTTFSENQGFDGFQDPGNQGGENAGGYDKVDNVNNQANVAAKVKQQQQQQHMALDQDNRPNNNMQYNRMTNNTIPGAIPSPPTQMNQMGTMQPQPWAYPLDRNSAMYNPYGAANQLNQSILMQGTHSIGTELFSGSNGAGGYRLQNTGHYPGSQQTTPNNVLISQANLISTGVKHSNQIGPIGSKAGTGANNSPYLQSGLGTLPNTFIQYDASNFNYVNPNAAGLQRGNAPPTQTAFYQTLASRQPQLALNAMPGTYNHALSQQQMRANHVAGLPFMKNDMSGLGNQKSPLGDNFGTGPSYNGRPSSPKTKQHHQQAKLAAGINNMNQLAQLRMSSLGYNMGIPGVQPGYPSPIARPQVNHGNHGHGNHGMPGKVDYYTQEGGGVEEKVEKDLEKGGEGKEPEITDTDQGDQETAEAS